MILSTALRRGLHSFIRYSCLQVLNPFNAGCRSYSPFLHSLGESLNLRQMINFRSYCVSEQLQEKWVTITFLRADGTRFQRRGKVGNTIQDLIKAESDPDLDGYGICGGNTLCATCQLIFPREYCDKLPKPTPEEKDLLSFTDISDRSRCGCCVDITEDMNGMVLEVPERSS